MSRGAGSAFAATLAVAALSVHELAFLLAGTEPGTDHGYLVTLAPMLAAVAAAAGLATVLLPSLGGERDPAPRLSPLPVAVALVAIFIVQEASEALIAGGGAEALAASLTAAWSLPALSLATAAAIVSFLSLLHRLGESLARLIGAPQAPCRGPGLAAAGLPSQASRRIRSPMAFGIACRPPPFGS